MYNFSILNRSYKYELRNFLYLYVSITTVLSHTAMRTIVFADFILHKLYYTSLHNDTFKSLSIKKKDDNVIISSMILIR